MNQEAQNYYLKKINTLPDEGVRIFDRPEVLVENVKKIHLIGVCGTAMGSLAGLLAKAGYKVSGSDVGCYPPMSDLIQELGIEFHEGYKASHLADTDLIIVGNAAGPQNPEAEYAREHKLSQCSSSEAVQRFFIEGKRSLVVSGTHGKTTTTGLLAHLFEHAGFDPSFLVGGVMQGYEQSFRLGKGNHFIIEGDEYDTAYFDKSPKFLHYLASSAIITSLEFDHADIYSDMEDYTQAFKFLVKGMPPEGSLFLCGDDENVRALVADASCNVSFYGLSERNSITARSIVFSPEGQEFELMIDGQSMGIFFMKLSGKHNLQNALAACGMALEEGMTLDELREGLKTFGGMKRRQEVVGEEKGITVIDDFAHHPTAVKETIKAMRERYEDRRMVAFFEPRSNTSRRKIFEEEYGKSFDQADLVYLSIPPFRHNDKKEDFIDAEKVVEAINKRGSSWPAAKAHYFSDAAGLLQAALPELREGDVVLAMSNGSFDGIHKKLLEMLRK